MRTSAAGHPIKVIGAILGWVAVIGQFYLIIVNRVYSIPITIVQFFSFFTVLTNILVACCYTFQLIQPHAAGNFWSSSKTQAALVVYILVVGIVYNLVLRFLWAPTGLQRVIDEMLHSIIPLFYFCYWAFSAAKNGLRWRFAIQWLLYPLVYLLYIMIRGAITNLYPYPFLDAYNHGYPKVIISIFVMLGLFLVMSLIIIGLGRKMSAVKESKGSAAV